MLRILYYQCGQNQREKGGVGLYYDMGIYYIFYGNHEVVLLRGSCSIGSLLKPVSGRQDGRQEMDPANTQN